MDSQLMNVVWIVLCAGFVFLMQAGFGLLETGSIRAKNAQNIMFKNLMDAAVTAIIYYLIGYSISYAPGGPFIGGSALMGLQVNNLPVRTT